MNAGEEMVVKKAALSFSPRQMEKFREAKGLSRRALSITLDVTEGTLYNWSIGKHVPDADQLSRMAEALGVGINDLYE